MKKDDGKMSEINKSNSFYGGADKRLSQIKIVAEKSLPLEKPNKGKRK